LLNIDATLYSKYLEHIHTCFLFTLQIMLFLYTY
jgi:hypothetical protein